MYNRSHGRRRPPVVPGNYSGNAFYRVPYEEKPPISVEPVEECEVRPSCEDIECECFEECEREKEEKHCDVKPIHEKSTLPFLSGKLFPHGLGNEELLILALILITAGNEDCTDLLLCLVLLLFC